MDADKELRELFDDEDVLACLDLELVIPGLPVLTGLCKVARPQRREGHTQYLSLVFVADAPGDADRQGVERVLAGLGGNFLAARLPGVETVLPLPPKRLAGGMVMKHVELILRRDHHPPEEELAVRLARVLEELPGVARSGVVWESGERGRRLSPEAGRSAGGGISGWLNRLLGRE